MLFAFVLALLCSVVASNPVSHLSTKRVASLKRQNAPDPTICGQIIDATNRDYTVFLASDAYSCLISVPFNPAVALRFIDYYNTTLQFQSTLAYLKNPPTGYQQPSVDVLAELATIKSKVNSEYYLNQYMFETDVQKLAYDMHDGHVDISAGILSVFSFASPYYVTSVSVNGKQAPQIFFKDDVLNHQQEGLDASPIVSINNQDVVTFLTDFAALQAVGNLEPHADWNQLMASPAQDIQGLTNIFGGGATFYPGDSLNFTLANGTSVDTYWLALYDNADFTGPLTTGGDFYNFFVLGLLPASYNESLTATAAAATSSTSSSAASATTSSTVSGNIIAGLGGDPTAQNNISWFDDSDGAYPNNPDIVQPNLSFGGGIVTGYFLEDASTAVLSLPSFEQFGDNLVSFVETVEDFIGNSTARKIPKLIIDLQQNEGGAVLLALTTFQQFFPNIDIFGGSRRRNHLLENILGETTTDWWDALDPLDEDDRESHYLFAASEWVVTNRINAGTGETFGSWSEFNDPQHYHGDAFSLTERYNLSDINFDRAAFDVPFSDGSDSDNATSLAQPWQAQDIIILTDGLCASACSLFVEMMTHQAGVQVIVMGGRPNGPSPMQAAGGGRGAILYDASTLDDDFTFAGQVNDTAQDLLPQDRDSGIFTSWMGFNLRDQIRENDAEPLQFKYLAADCRLYYTLANVYNMSRLWRDVAQAAWNDRSLCVPGSQGYSASGNSTVSEAPLPPPPAPLHTNASLPAANFPTNESLPIDPQAGGLQDGGGPERSDGTLELCDPGGHCSPGSTCKSINILCRTSTQATSVQACLPRCNKRVGCKDPNTYCPADTKETTKFNSFERQTAADALGTQAINAFGLCFPKYANLPGTTKLGCPS